MAVDEKGGIGFQNKLLKHNSQDLAFFSGLTQGKICLVGHNTLKTLPNLVNRVIVEDDRDLTAQGMFLSLAYSESDIVIIGGAKTYEKYASLTSELYITTHKNFVAEECDTYVNLNSFDHLVNRVTILENKDIKIEVWK